MIEDINRNCELDLTPLPCQVAGHTFQKDSNSLGLLSVKGGYVLKPASNAKKGKREIEFYESLQENTDPFARELKTYVPRFFGTTEIWTNEQLVRWLVLEDACYGFKEPCIMDAKMGRQTWDPSAPQEKIQAESKKYVESKREVGFCIPGFQVYDVSNQKLRRFDSAYGKSLDGNGVREAIRTFLNGDLAFSRTLLLQFLAKLWQILRWFRTQNRYHFFGSSLLLVYDAAILREDFKMCGKKNVNGCHRPTVARQLSLRIPTGPLTPGFEPRKKSPGSGPSTPTPGSSHTPLPSLEDLENDFDSMCKTHSLENNYEKDLQSMKENYSVVLNDLLKDRLHAPSWVNVKMIDFAHVFPGNAIDKNYLQGLENFVSIFETFLMEADD